MKEVNLGVKVNDLNQRLVLASLCLPVINLSYLSTSATRSYMLGVGDSFAAHTVHQNFNCMTNNEL